MKIIQQSWDWLDEKPDGAAILRKITKAGRIAYKSQKNGDEARFLQMIIDRGHESVIEHATLSVVVTTDRGITHEAVRHRIASFTQESTRYVNYSLEKNGGQVAYIDIASGMARDKSMFLLSPAQISDIIDEWVHACEDAEKHYVRMIELGASPQIARSVLNNSTATVIAITMNIREWRHFFKLRCAPDAHPQMRALAESMLQGFKAAIPVLFDDI